MEPQETELWVELASGKAVRVRLATVTEGLPSPGETDRVTEPTVREFLDACRLLFGGEVSLKKPF